MTKVEERYRISRKSGTIHDGNLCKSTGIQNYLFETGHTESLQGYSGVSEFQSFPLRQLFLTKHKCFAHEWDGGTFHQKYVDEFIQQNQNKILSIIYDRHGKSIQRAVLYLGGREHIYVYLYNRNPYLAETEDIGNFAAAMLFTKKTKRVEKSIEYFVKLSVSSDVETYTGNIHILTQDHNGFHLIKKAIPKPEIDFGTNYNSDFEPIHNIIMQKLDVDNSKGLVLLNGLPGTGKTTYIRYLINVLKKRVIYIPPNIVNSISDPAIINFFIQHSNSVFIIEDAENILAARQAGGTQAISNILNLGDGLLSDACAIQIIATFNTDLKNIDEALLRKGRLIAKYTFGELSKDRAAKLYEKLNLPVNGKGKLCDIYNAAEVSFEKEKISIGFN